MAGGTLAVGFDVAALVAVDGGVAGPDILSLQFAFMVSRFMKANGSDIWRGKAGHAQLQGSEHFTFKTGLVQVYYIIKFPNRDDFVALGRREQGLLEGEGPLIYFCKLTNPKPYTVAVDYFSNRHGDLKRAVFACNQAGRAQPDRKPWVTTHFPIGPLATSIT